MIKRGAGSGRVLVTFEVDPAVQAERANLCGEFNDWSQDTHPMERRHDGGFTHTLELEPGRAYRFRYLLDGERWENDWAADDYVPNEYGGDDSLVDLTHVDGLEPPPVKAAKKAEGTKKAPAKKAAAKKAPAEKAAAKKAPAAKKAAKKKAAPPEE